MSQDKCTEKMECEIIDHLYYTREIKWKVKNIWTALSIANVAIIVGHTQMGKKSESISCFRLFLVIFAFDSEETS